MRLLLDTHVLLAPIERGSAGLSAGLFALVTHRDSQHYLSAASLLGNRHQMAAGQAHADAWLERLASLLADMGIKVIAINEHHALASVEPEPVTRDPFDRMLLTQCWVEGLKILTMDRALVSHPLAANT